MPVRWPWRIRPDRETGAMQTNPNDPYWDQWQRKYPSSLKGNFEPPEMQMTLEDWEAWRQIQRDRAAGA